MPKYAVPKLETNKLVRSLRVEPGTRAGLAGRDPGSRLGLHDKQAGLERLDELVTMLGLLHDRLWAESQRSLLLVLQGARRVRERRFLLRGYERFTSRKGRLPSHCSPSLGHPRRVA